MRHEPEDGLGQRPLIKSVRYSAEEWERVCELAAACGKRPSVFVRDRSLGRLRLPGNQIAVRQLAGVANNVNQWTRYSHEQRSLPPGLILIDLVDEIRDVLIQLAQGPPEEGSTEL